MRSKIPSDVRLWVCVLAEINGSKETMLMTSTNEGADVPYVTVASSFVCEVEPRL